MYQTTDGIRTNETIVVVNICKKDAKSSTSINKIDSNLRYILMHGDMDAGREPKTNF